MWFKNTDTGHIWQIHDEEVIKDLQSKAHFTEVESPVEPKKKPSKDTKIDSMIECEQCGKECKNQRSYTMHVRMAHKDGDE